MNGCVAMNENTKKRNKLATLLRQRLDVEGLSVRDAGEKIGVSHSTVARAVNGEAVNIDTLIRICDFLNVPVVSILNIRGDKDELMEEMMTMISIEPELADVFSEISKDLTKGRINSNILFEIAAFAQFRLHQARKLAKK